MNNHLEIITKVLMTACILFSIGPEVHGQAKSEKRYTISGTISDKSSGETLIGASVRADGTPNGTLSNEYGFYSFSLAAGNYIITVNFIGYETITDTVELHRDFRWDVGMTEQSAQLDEVTITANAQDNNVSNINPGNLELSMQDIKKLPVLFGEQDPIKILQLLPGIKSSGEGNSGFHVRGGTSDQNLVLLDEAIVYNPSHMLGFFATVHADAIQDLSREDGGRPAEDAPEGDAPAEVCGAEACAGEDGAGDAGAACAAAAGCGR